MVSPMICRRIAPTHLLAIVGYGDVDVGLLADERPFVDIRPPAL